MSRVGKHEVVIPDSVKLEMNGNVLSFTAKGVTEKYTLTDSVKVERTEKGLLVKPADETRFARSMWGTTRRNLFNIVHGLSIGFTSTLDLVGVGYRAAVAGSKLTMQLGFSHDVVFDAPAGITFKCPKPTTIEVCGHNKQQVNQMCALLREKRPPEPYKGKGVIRAGEFVLRKEGKKK